MAEKSSEQGGADVRPAAPAGKTEPASPHEHAKALGSFRKRSMRAGDVAVTSINGQSVSTDNYSWQHNAAAALHGWAEHEHHEAKPLEMSADDYKAALLAASKPVTRVIRKDGKPGDVIDSHEAADRGIPTHTDYEPHPAALSRHAAHAKKAAAQAVKG
jgi:hypothetical protein